MPQYFKAGTDRAFAVVGTDEAAVVTNGATSGTLYIGPSTVSASSNTFSIAAGASRVVQGPAWCIASTSIPVSATEVPVPKRMASPVVRYFTGGTPSDEGAGSGSIGGTATTFTAGQVKVGEANIYQRTTLTGIRVLASTPVSTDLLLVALYDYTGLPLAWSAVAGTAFPTANTWGAIAFISPYEVKTPGRYFLGVVANGTTDKVQVYDATVGQPGAVSYLGGTVSSAWTVSSAPTAITVPTTVGALPVLSTY